MADQPHTPIQTERLELVLLTAGMMTDLLAGRREAVHAAAGLTIPDDWPDDHDARFLRMRVDQLAEAPETVEWLVRVIVLREDPDRRMIGHMGFHGPPIEGAAEFGYTVFPANRGKGIATEAALGIMAWGRKQGLQRFVLSISPGNDPSLAIARKLGFQRTGQHMDEEDGLEYVFELKA